MNREEEKAACKWNHMARDCDNWHLCKAGCFSYSESPLTPPLEGTSLHRWNNSVERPWGILSLFTITSAVTLPQSVTHVNYTLKKHTKMRRALGNAPKTETTWWAGKKVYEEVH